jgi:hypothetical protein
MANDELGLRQQVAAVGSVVAWNYRNFNGLKLRQLKAAEKTLTGLLEIREKLELAIQNDEMPDGDELAEQIVSVLGLQQEAPSASDG